MLRLRVEDDHNELIRKSRMIMYNSEKNHTKRISTKHNVQISITYSKFRELILSTRNWLLSYKTCLND